MDAPQEVVLALDLVRGAERNHPAALRIQSGEHPPDRAVFARRVHALEHEQHRPLFLGPQAVLEDLEPLHQLGQASGGDRLALAVASAGIALIQLGRLAGWDDEGVEHAGNLTV